MYKDYIFLDGRLFYFIDRKCSESKVSSTPSESLDGTLNIDVLSNGSKKKISFVFEVDARGLARLRNLWSINSKFLMVDWDDKKYNVACISQTFDETFIGQDGDDYWFSVSLEFKQV